MLHLVDVTPITPYQVLILSGGTSFEVGSNTSSENVGLLYFFLS